MDSGSSEHTAIHDRVYVGRKLSEFESSPAFEPVTKVILWYDDESSYAAGDDGGRVLELTCPWATQAMAENILASVSGFVYRPFSGTGALLDPAAELGDAVTVNGVYSMLANMDTNFDALCLSDISAPADEEVDHEYPYQSPQGRELRRKVSLEQKYYGTKISRREGLVIEKTDGDSVEARVVLNAEKLAFYDGSGQEQLYFDPAEGVYKFRGALNVNDKFVVEKSGDVTMKGSINLAGNINMSGGVITWGQNGPVKYQFSSVGITGPWHDTMQTNDKYRRDSLDGGTTWGAGYQFVGVDGQNGQDGADGSDADVTYNNIKTALNRAANAAITLISGASIDTADIYAQNIYGGRFSAGLGAQTFTQMDGGGLSVFREDVQQSKVFIGLDEYGTTPQIHLGAGDGSGHNIFDILKTERTAHILYDAPGGQLVGFTFRADGTIEVIGEIKGVYAQFA